MGNLISDIKAEKSKFSLILFVYNLTIGCAKKNRENYPTELFGTNKKETRIKIKPWVGANRPSNNWALILLIYSFQYFSFYYAMWKIGLWLN